MISKRINRLLDRTLKGEMFVVPIKTNYDPSDHFLSETKRAGKRVCEYILNQEPLITEDSLFTGMITFDGSVEGDIFTRLGFPNFEILRNEFYNRPIDNLLTFEWQHSVEHTRNQCLAAEVALSVWIGHRNRTSERGSLPFCRSRLGYGLVERRPA